MVVFTDIDAHHITDVFRWSPFALNKFISLFKLRRCEKSNFAFQAGSHKPEIVLFCIKFQPCYIFNTIQLITRALTIEQDSSGIQIENLNMSLLKSNSNTFLWIFFVSKHCTSLNLSLMIVSNFCLIIASLILL